MGFLRELTRKLGAGITGFRNPEHVHPPVPSQEVGNQAVRLKDQLNTLQEAQRNPDNSVRFSALSNSIVALRETNTLTSDFEAVASRMEDIVETRRRQAGGEDTIQEGMSPEERELMLLNDYAERVRGVTDVYKIRQQLISQYLGKAVHSLSIQEAMTYLEEESEITLPQEQTPGVTTTDSTNHVDAIAVLSAHKLDAESHENLMQAMSTGSVESTPPPTHTPTAQPTPEQTNLEILQNRGFPEPTIAQLMLIKAQYQQSLATLRAKLQAEGAPPAGEPAPVDNASPLPTPIAYEALTSDTELVQAFGSADAVRALVDIGATREELESLVKAEVDAILRDPSLADALITHGLGNGEINLATIVEYACSERMSVSALESAARRYVLSQVKQGPNVLAPAIARLKALALIEDDKIRADAEALTQPEQFIALCELSFAGLSTTPKVGEVPFVFTDEQLRILNLHIVQAREGPEGSSIITGQYAEQAGQMIGEAILAHRATLDPGAFGVALEQSGAFLTNLEREQKTIIRIRDEAVQVRTDALANALWLLAEAVAKHVLTAEQVGTEVGNMASSLGEKLLNTTNADEVAHIFTRIENLKKVSGYPDSLQIQLICRTAAIQYLVKAGVAEADVNMLKARLIEIVNTLKPNDITTPADITNIEDVVLELKSLPGYAKFGFFNRLPEPIIRWIVNRLHLKPHLRAFPMPAELEPQAAAPPLPPPTGGGQVPPPPPSAPPPPPPSAPVPLPEESAEVVYPSVQEKVSDLEELKNDSHFIAPEGYVEQPVSEIEIPSWSKDDNIFWPEDITDSNGNLLIKWIIHEDHDPLKVFYIEGTNPAKFKYIVDETGPKALTIPLRNGEYLIRAKAAHLAGQVGAYAVYAVVFKKEDEQRAQKEVAAPTEVTTRETLNPEEQVQAVQELGKLALFRNVSDQVLQDVAKRMKKSHLNMSEKATEGSEIVFVRSGEVTIPLHDTNSSTLPINAGEHFGQWEMFNRIPIEGATVTSKDGAGLWYLTGSDYDDALAANPPLGERLSEVESYMWNELGIREYKKKDGNTKLHEIVLAKVAAIIKAGGDVEAYIVHFMSKVTDNLPAIPVVTGLARWYAAGAEAVIALLGLGDQYKGKEFKERLPTVASYIVSSIVAQLSALGEAFLLAGGAGALEVGAVARGARLSNIVGDGVDGIGQRLVEGLLALKDEDTVAQMIKDDPKHGLLVAILKNSPELETQVADQLQAKGQEVWNQLKVTLEREQPPIPNPQPQEAPRYYTDNLATDRYFSPPDGFTVISETFRDKSFSQSDWLIWDPASTPIADGVTFYCTKWGPNDVKTGVKVKLNDSRQEIVGQGATNMLEVFLPFNEGEGEIKTSDDKYRVRAKLVPISATEWRLCTQAYSKESALDRVMAELKKPPADKVADAVGDSNWISLASWAIDGVDELAVLAFDALKRNEQIDAYVQSMNRADFSREISRTIKVEKRKQSIRTFLNAPEYSTHLTRIASDGAYVEVALEALTMLIEGQKQREVCYVFYQRVDNDKVKKDALKYIKENNLWSELANIMQTVPLANEVFIGGVLAQFPPGEPYTQYIEEIANKSKDTIMPGVARAVAAERRNSPTLPAGSPEGEGISEVATLVTEKDWSALATLALSYEKDKKEKANLALNILIEQSQLDGMLQEMCAQPKNQDQKERQLAIINVVAQKHGDPSSWLGLISTSASNQEVATAALEQLVTKKAGFYICMTLIQTNHQKTKNKAGAYIVENNLWTVLEETLNRIPFNEQYNIAYALSLFPEGEAYTNYIEAIAKEASQAGVTSYANAELTRRRKYAEIRALITDSSVTITTQNRPAIEQVLSNNNWRVSEAPTRSDIDLALEYGDRLAPREKT